MEKGKMNIPKGAMKGIKSLIGQYITAGKDIDIERLVKHEMNNIVNDWKKAHLGYSIEPRLIKEHAALLEEVKHMRPELRIATQDLVLSCHKAMKAHAISETSARAMVSALLEEAGYKNYYIISQRYRIKVTVVIGKNRICLPVKFSALPSICEKIIPAVKAAEKMYADFGRDLKIG